MFEFLRSMCVRMSLSSQKSRAVSRGRPLSARFGTRLELETLENRLLPAALMPVLKSPFALPAISASHVATVISPIVRVITGPAAVGAFHLAVTSQPPATVRAGSPFSIVVKVEDRFGNLVPSFNGSVTISLATYPQSATLGGTLTVKAVLGVAIFNNLTISKPGNGFTLKVASTGVSSVTTTNSVTVTAASVPVANLPSHGSQITIQTSQRTNAVVICVSADVCCTGVDDLDPFATDGTEDGSTDDGSDNNDDN